MSKKNFNVDNPALQFITPTEENDPSSKDLALSHAVEQKRGRPASKEETKTKRLNLLILPSVHENIDKIAAMKRSSINDLINSILIDYVQENSELINKYNQVFENE